jgi:hypothetical protein
VPFVYKGHALTFEVKEWTESGERVEKLLALFKDLMYDQGNDVENCGAASLTNGLRLAN